jgi:hypothetical protein
VYYRFIERLERSCLPAAARVVVHECPVPAIARPRPSNRRQS